jgi:mannose-6-phosphate isomerase-like protein (cupin superfamily)
MREKWIGLYGIVLVSICCATMLQAQRGPAAPKTEVKFWSVDQLDTMAKELHSPKSTTNNQQLFVEEHFNTEEYSPNGKEAALVHGKRVDLFIIRSGSATFAYGGQLVNAKPGNNPGDFSGESIKGAILKVMKPGDVVYVPAGVPHYFSSIPDHVDALLVRWDAQ